MMGLDWLYWELVRGTGSDAIKDAYDEKKTGCDTT